MKNQVFIKVIVENHCEQYVSIQPASDSSDCLELYIKEIDDSSGYGPFYLNEAELDSIYEQAKLMFKRIKND